MRYCSVTLTTGGTSMCSLYCYLRDEASLSYFLFSVFDDWFYIVWSPS